MPVDSAEGLQLWNVHDGATAVVGAQRHFNVVGRVAAPGEVQSLRARLNGSVWTPVAVNLTARPKARLCAPGDFNIDFIDIADLRRENVLELVTTYRDGGERRHVVRFAAAVQHLAQPDLELRLDSPYVEEHAQVVDGRWQVTDDGTGAALSIGRADAGYDRIALFGDRAWTTGYQIDACISVDAWTHPVHNVGLLFKWNPHRLGRDGKLPTEWNTGLAYFAASSPGLRLRYGVDVRFDETGAKLGDNVLAEVPFTAARLPTVGRKALFRATGGRLVQSQLRAGRTYRFRAVIHPAEHALAVWADGKPEPTRPQVVVPSPDELLATGAVGVIAQNAAVRVHSFAVRPVGQGGLPGAEPTNRAGGRTPPGGRG